MHQGDKDVDRMCSEFVAAVRCGDEGLIDALGHKLYVDHGLTHSDLWRLVREAERRQHPREHNPLTERELTILAAVAQGRSNQEIARRLHLAESTVKTYVSRIFIKVGTRDRTHAVMLSISRGWIDFDALLVELDVPTEEDPA